MKRPGRHEQVVQVEKDGRQQVPIKTKPSKTEMLRNLVIGIIFIIVLSYVTKVIIEQFEKISTQREYRKLRQAVSGTKTIEELKYSLASSPKEAQIHGDVIENSCFSNSQGLLLFRQINDIIDNPFVKPDFTLFNYPTIGIATETRLLQTSEHPLYDTVSVADPKYCFLLLQLPLWDDQFLSFYTALLPAVETFNSKCNSTTQEAVLISPARTQFLLNLSPVFLKRMFGVRTDLFFLPSKRTIEGTDNRIICVEELNVVERMWSGVPLRHTIVKRVSPGLFANKKSLVVLTQSEGRNMLLNTSQISKLARDEDFYPIVLADPSQSDSIQMFSALNVANVVIGPVGPALALATFFTGLNVTIIAVNPGDDENEKQKRNQWLRKLIAKDSIRVLDSPAERAESSYGIGDPIQCNLTHIQELLEIIHVSK